MGVKGAFKRNIRKQIKGIPSDIVVINERVQLNEGGFVASTDGNVEFSTEYFPEGVKTPDEVAKAKIVFARIFSQDSGFNTENPIPPSDINDYSILREGLQYRLERIRDQVRKDRRIEGDSVRILALMEQGVRIKKLLDDMATNEAHARSYEKEGSYGDDKLSIEKVSNINDDQIRRLIRNFSFLVLQALNPVAGYDEKMLINPVDLINVLDNEEFRESDMQKFLEEYKKTSDIPRLIGLILTDTNTQESITGMLLEDEKKKFLGEIIGSLTNSLDPERKSAFEIYQTEIQGTDSSAQMGSIIGWVVKEIKRAADLNSKQAEELVGLEGQKATLVAQIREIESEQGSLKAQLAEEQNSVVEGPVIPATVIGDNGRANATIHTLERQMAELTEALDKSKADLEQTNEDIAKNENGVAVTQKMYNGLRDLLKVTEQELEEALVENGRLQGEIDKFTQEKAEVEAELATLRAKPAEQMSPEERAELEGQIAGLTERTKDYDEKLEELANLKAKLEANKDLEGKLLASTEGHTELESKLKATKELADARERQIEEMATGIEALKSGNAQAAEVALNNAMATNQAELDRQAAQLAEKEAELSKAKKELAELKGTLEGNREAHETLKNDIKTTASQRDDTRARIIEMAKKIQDGTITADQIRARDDVPDDEKGAFLELLNIVQKKSQGATEANSNMTDVCYLNYFVSYFIRELFYIVKRPNLVPNTAVKDIKSYLISRISSVPNTKIILDQIFNTLQSDVKAISHPELSEFIKASTENTGNLENVFSIKFPVFFNIVNGKNYTVGGTSVNYLSLFTYFIFFARKYLLEIQGELTKCPINPILSENTSGPISIKSYDAIVAPAPKPTVVEPTVALFNSSNTKTMAGILYAIYKGGSGISNLPSIMSDIDISKATLNTPIIRFINKYRTVYSKYIKIGLTDANFTSIFDNLTDDGANLAVNTERYSIIFTKMYVNYKRDHDREPTMAFLRQFVLDFFNAYVNQYNIDGNPAATVGDRANAFIQPFSNYIGNATINGKTVYQVTDLDDAKLKNYASMGGAPF